jgi:hypothetical protein
LIATSSDNVAVASVQFKVDGTNIGSAITSSPYATTWNSNGISDGSHTLYAVATDNWGNHATSSLSVIVQNSVPAVVSSNSGGSGFIVGSGPLAPGYLNTKPVSPAVISPGTSGTQTSAPSEQPTSQSGIVITRNHQIWDSEQDIYVLQRWLNANGFVIAKTGSGSPGNESSTFGTHTYRALIEFQKSIGLPQTGYLGPLTRAALAQ